MSIWNITLNSPWYEYVKNGTKSYEGFELLTKTIQELKKVVYCRVSCKKQEEDLNRQKEFFKREYPEYTIYSDIGSGLNWKRKCFKNNRSFEDIAWY